MGKQLSVLLIAAVVGVVLFFIHTEAGAVADGNGSCSVTETQSSDCGLFGSTNAVIEFIGSSASTCVVVAGAVPCTSYSYKYTGGTTNQINVLIPKAVMTKFTSSDAAAAGCSQLITNGGGDPTTGFGKNDVTHNLCRITPNLGPGATFAVKADPSTIAPLSWQVRISSNNIGAAAVNGPGRAQAAVEETGASLQTSDGVTCTYTNQGGQVTLTNCPTGRVVPINQTKLCLPTVGAQIPTFTNGSGSFTCETLAFTTDGCDIKTTGSDPTRCFASGTCIVY